MHRFHFPFFGDDFYDSRTDGRTFPHWPYEVNCGSRELITLIYGSSLFFCFWLGCINGVWNLYLQPWHRFSRSSFRLRGRLVGLTVLLLPRSSKISLFSSGRLVTYVWPGKSGLEAKNSSLFHHKVVHLGKAKTCFDLLGLRKFPKKLAPHLSNFLLCFCVAMKLKIGHSRDREREKKICKTSFGICSVWSDNGDETGMDISEYPSIDEI